MRFEEADSGYSGCSGCEAGWGVAGCDAAEGQNGDGVGEGADGGEFFETRAGEFVQAFREVEGFAEDGAEEDEVGRVREGGSDLGAGVAGFADRGGGQVVGAVEMPDLGRGEGAGGGGEVDSVGRGGEGYVGPGVDQEACAVVVLSEDGEDFAAEVDELRGLEVFFAELEKFNSGARQTMNLIEQGRGLALWQSVLSSGDRVADHGSV